jgi:hypothetical protein
MSHSLVSTGGSVCIERSPAGLGMCHAPDIRYFETAVVVDNASDKILADAA